MIKPLADRIELLSSINLTERYELANEVRALKAEKNETKEQRDYFRDSKERQFVTATLLIDALKTQLEDCTAVNAEVMKKVARLEEKLDDIDTCELCEGEVEGCSICLECWNKLAPGAAELKAQLAEYKYTSQAYDEMWDRLIKAVNENDELKAENTELKKFHANGADDETIAELLITRKERDELKAQLEDCTAVNAEVMKKVARLEKAINNQETDSN